MLEPQQGLTYAELLGIAKVAEESGFEALFRSDHYTSFPGDSLQPTTDAWMTLAGLARETSRISLGVLVSPVTFRLPGPFFKQVMTVDEMSGGRIEVGVGAGWNATEHSRHGIPYPNGPERVDMLEEELQILTGFWDEPDGWSFDGAHWQVREAQVRPKDRSAWGSGDGRRRPNLITGGSGRPRSLRLAARYADEYNMSSSTADACRDAYAQLAEECRAIGRDPRAVTRSVMAGAIVGRDDAEVHSRIRDLIEVTGGGDESPEKWLAERRARWIIGTPDQAREQVAEFEAAGAERVMLQTLIPRDLEHVRLLAEIFVGN
jgi:alkanesulfonate monooxygenase SsuD/methylene tetrahydromethanopterin reductase-like flavin-dependent oxidoreductase (luciferase family)